MPEELFEKLKEKILLYNQDVDFTLIEKAYDVAKVAHAEQKRKSGEPYMIHPTNVAYILAEFELDDETLCAALLHDVVEDTPRTHEDLVKDFGTTIAEMVAGVTKLGKLRYTTQEEEQVENYRKMFLAMGKDIRVILIKLADRLHNMRTLKFLSRDRQIAIAKETIDLYAPLANRLGIYSFKWELEDLSFKYLKPEEYHEIVVGLDRKRDERLKFINKIQEDLEAEIKDQGIKADVTGRAKHLYSIHRKMLRDNKTLDQIYDLFALRILVDSVKDCYGTLGIVHSMWRPIPGRFKDYIAVPKSNMYQSLHTTVVGSMDQPLEIQIRTHEMHRISEYGIAAHWRYKESGGSKAATGSEKNYAEKMSWLRQLLEWHNDMNDSHEFVDSVKMDIFADEVFVFTPRGDVIDLPQGSCPIDFAYRIHTDVGNRCVGAKVNGRIVPLDYHLKNGDIVEVITSKQSNGPSRDWLNIVGSSDTKNKIRSWFKKERREENIVKGREMLEHDAKRLGYEPKVLLKSDKLVEIAVKLRQDTEENLLAALGYGGVLLGTVMTKLVEMYKKEQQATVNKDLAQVLAELKPRKSKAKNSHGILVKGEDGIMVKLARCCNPIPGDPVVGYITRGTGVSVHRRDCVNVLNATPADVARMVDVAWDIGVEDVFKVTIFVLSADRPGLMVDMLAIVSDEKVNIYDLKTHTDKNKRASIHIGMDVNSLDQVERVMNRIRRMKDVYSVEREISGTANRQHAASCEHHHAKESK